MEEKEIWGAKLCEQYYYLNDCLDVTCEIEAGNYKDNLHWIIGNYFRTYEEAVEASFSITECFMTIHKLI